MMQKTRAVSAHIRRQTAVFKLSEMLKKTEAWVFSVEFVRILSRKTKFVNKGYRLFSFNAHI